MGDAGMAIRFRRLMSFRLRTLLLLTTVVAILCGWLGRQVYRKSIERPVVELVTAKGGQVGYQHQWNSDRVIYDPSIEAPGPKWLRTLLGDDLFTVAESARLIYYAEEDLQQVAKLPNLTTLQLWGESLGDAGVDSLRKMEQLESLSCVGVTLPDESFGRLAQLPRLTALSLTGKSATGEHVRQLAEFANLQDLTLMESKATEDDFRSLGGLRKLETLEVFRCPQFTDQSFAGFKQLTKLKSVRLVETGFQGETLAAIGELRSLESLYFLGHPIDDHELASLSELSNLVTLELSKTKITNQGLASLAGLSRLQVLAVEGTPITDEAVATLLGFQKLETLNIGKTKITDAGLHQLRRLEGLKHIRVSLGEGITVRGAREFQKQMPNCEVKCIEWYPDGTGASIDVDSEAAAGD